MENSIRQKKCLHDRGNRAMFALMQRARTLSLPIDVNLKLFHSLVASVLLYGAEVWGEERSEIIEKVHLKFLKHLLQVNKSTCSNMIYGELGEPPLDIVIKCKMLNFWISLISPNVFKLSQVFYKLLLALDRKKNVSSPWLTFIKSILNTTGFSGCWETQSIPGSRDWFLHVMKQRLLDQFIQKWRGELNASSKCLNYRLFKFDFTLEKYLLILSKNLRIQFTKFRCRNHRLPIEAGTHESVLRDTRVCNLCDMHPKDIGDEFHYLMKCKYFCKEREKYLKTKFFINPSVFKFSAIINSKELDLIKVSKFISIILNRFKK